MSAMRFLEFIFCYQGYKYRIARFPHGWKITLSARNPVYYHSCGSLWDAHRMARRKIDFILSWTCIHAQGRIDAIARMYAYDHRQDCMDAIQDCMDAVNN